MSNRVIGLCGFIGSGKGTVGEILVEEHGFVRLSFAKRLKDAVGHLFNWDRELLEGVTKESREWREKVDPFWTSEFGFKVTPRLVLQRFGSECMRQGLHDNIWISMVKKYMIDNPGSYVITDVRFRNEQVMIRSMGGYVWQVRKGEMPEWFEIAKANDLDPSIIENKYNVHQSEFKWIDEDSKFETIIENDGTIDDLKIKVREEIKKYEQ